MTTNYDAIAIERGEKALVDAQPIADDLARLLDTSDANPTHVVVAAHDLALSFQRASMYLNPDSGYGAMEYKESAHADLFETFDDAAIALERLRPPHPRGTPMPAEDVQACRDALAAYQAMRAACLETSASVTVTAIRTRLTRVRETYNVDVPRNALAAATGDREEWPAASDAAGYWTSESMFDQGVCDRGQKISTVIDSTDDDDLTLSLVTPDGTSHRVI